MQPEAAGLESGRGRPADTQEAGMGAEAADLESGRGRPASRRPAWRPSLPALTPALPATEAGQTGILPGEDLAILLTTFEDFLV